MRTQATRKTSGVAPITGSALLLAMTLASTPAAVMAQQDDVVIDPVEAPAASATPTLLETTSLVSGIFSDLNRQLQGALDAFAECRAAGVIDAGRPDGDLQERTCQVRFYGALQDAYMASHEGFRQAGQHLFVQRELLQRDQDALQQAIVALESDVSDAEAGMAVVAEEMRAFLETMGGIPTEDDREAQLRFRTLDEQYRRSEILVAQLSREVSANRRAIADIEQQRELFAEFGYGFYEWSETQHTQSMEVGYRLAAARDDIEWMRNGAGGIPPGMIDVADSLAMLRDTLGRATLPAVAPIDPDDVPVTELPDIGPGADAAAAERWSTILGKDIQDLAATNPNTEATQ
ncbi:hypothetical protein DEA8626_02995 [Defluviimonas aquaemixtae]|uniref:Chromosome partition protein Smc n=1 Tax=Albidovulum aquaemixtae TaxID=1542388 RepID=A0A2R8BKL3_9RHOB|nr:hypothetical protein [Defluviimonas aquaemixtae]SPH23918.1 hypothetical protein DEA8626_02995 [Defluviimonas aquaemixtae]